MPASNDTLLSLSGKAGEEIITLLQDIAPEALSGEREVSLSDAADVIIRHGIFPFVRYGRPCSAYPGCGYFEYGCDSSSGPAFGGGRADSYAEAFRLAVRGGLELLRLRQETLSSFPFYY